MKKSLLFACAALALSAFAAEAPFNGKVPLKNSGFEEGIAEWKPWGQQPKAPKNPVLSIVTDAASGKAALKIHDEWTDCAPYVVQFYNLPAAPDNRITVSLMAKADKGQQFLYGFQCLSATKYLCAKTAVGVGTGEWTRYTATFAEIPENGTRFTMMIRPNPGEFKLTGTVLVDDISVTVDRDPMALKPTPADKTKLGGKQIELCMIGDSITWIIAGDTFRGYLLKEIPELAFVGTHTAKLGYSHAGEGGDNTAACLRERIDDPSRIPNSRYYHVLMGVNDSNAPYAEAKRNPKADLAQLQKEGARKIADRLLLMCEKLLKRPGTEKVFLGTIMPCYPDRKTEPPEVFVRYESRDATAAKVNEFLRADVPAKFGGKVVLVEYEKPLRAMPDWKAVIRLHPTQEGYRRIAPILAKAIRAEAKPANGPAGEYGVEVINLWDPEKQQTQRMIPGHYIVSFKAENVKNRKATFRLVSDGTGIRRDRKPADIKVEVAMGSGGRGSFIFTLGGDRQVLQIKDADCDLSEIMVEKMRPDKYPSPYCVGRHVDTQVGACLGELLVPAK